MMKPKGQSEHDTGLLEYLEDIIGSDKFKVQSLLLPVVPIIMFIVSCVLLL